MFRVKSGAVEGTRFGDQFVPDEMRDAHRTGLTRYIRSRKGSVINTRVELEALRMDGSRFPVELTIAPIDLNGSIEFTAYLRDLTDIFEARKEIEGARLEQGRLAREIQNNLLLGRIPDCPELEVAADFIACHDVGGDFLDFARVSGGMDLLLGDVMGKGVPAALVGATVKTAFTSRRASFGQAPLDIETLVNEVAIEFGPRLIELERFVTLTYARFDFRSGTLRFVDCGHMKPIRVSRDGAVELLKGSNLPIGVVEGDTIIARDVSVDEGDLLAFYSDGLAEAEAPSGEQFGVERIVDLLVDERASNPDTLVKRLSDELQVFTGRTVLEDDYTVAIVRVRLSSDRPDLVG